MADNSLGPIKGSAYTTYVSLGSQADTDLFQTSVTLAAGDVTVSKDGAGFNNIATLPVEIGTSGVLSVALSAAEMTADAVVVRFRDAADGEWQDAQLMLFPGTNRNSALSTHTAAGVWTSATRTLTQSGASVAATVAGSTITLYRGDYWSASITGVGDISERAKLYFTVKQFKANTDAQALLQVVESNPAAGTDGCLIWNGATRTAANATLTVTDEDTGAFTLAVKQTITKDATPDTYCYDLQMIDSDGPTTMLVGSFVVSEDVTRTIT